MATTHKQTNSSHHNHSLLWILVAIAAVLLAYGVYATYQSGQQGDRMGISYTTGSNIGTNNTMGAGTPGQ